MFRELTKLAKRAYKQSFDAGWWTEKDGTHSTFNPLTFSRKLLLIVTEIAEACEGDRKGGMDEHLPHRTKIAVELADVVIRTLETSAAYDIDIGAVVEEKLAYNLSRADHSQEARSKAGGKKY